MSTMTEGPCRRQLLLPSCPLGRARGESWIPKPWPSGQLKQLQISCSCQALRALCESDDDDLNDGVFPPDPSPALSETEDSA